jgi:hypothetical protein
MKPVNSCSCVCTSNFYNTQYQAMHLVCKEAGVKRTEPVETREKKFIHQICVEK